MGASNSIPAGRTIGRKGQRRWSAHYTDKRRPTVAAGKDNSSKADERDEGRGADGLTERGDEDTMGSNHFGLLSIPAFRGKEESSDGDV